MQLYIWHVRSVETFLSLQQLLESFQAGFLSPTGHIPLLYFTQSILLVSNLTVSCSASPLFASLFVSSLSYSIFLFFLHTFFPLYHPLCSSHRRNLRSAKRLTFLLLFLSRYLGYQHFRTPILHFYVHRSDNNFFLPAFTIVLAEDFIICQDNPFPDFFGTKLFRC